MDGERFDAIVRSAAGLASRRGVLRSSAHAIVGSALGLIGIGVAQDADAKKKNKKKKKKKKKKSTVPPPPPPACASPGLNDTVCEGTGRCLDGSAIPSRHVRATGSLATPTQTAVADAACQVGRIKTSFTVALRAMSGSLA